jgi:hypothetical protein
LATEPVDGVTAFGPSLRKTEDLTLAPFIAGVTPDEVRFSCVAAGLARSTVHLFEPQSLLSTTATVELTFAP